MSNANFGYDCRNDVNNAKFEPIIGEINEISYIKKYYNLFDNKVSNFVNSDILERQKRAKFLTANCNCETWQFFQIRKNNVNKKPG